MLINIHDAKTHFSKIINQVLKGEEVIISKSGKPLIKLIPFAEETKSRKGGQLKGLMQISDDFDAPLPDEILKQFYGDE